jgi:hypothetical protein
MMPLPAAAGMAAATAIGRTSSGPPSSPTPVKVPRRPPVSAAATIAGSAAGRSATTMAGVCLPGVTKRHPRPPAVALITSGG